MRGSTWISVPLLSGLMMELKMDKAEQLTSQLAVWWAHEQERDFTKLECGLLGAVFSAIGIGFIVTVRLLFA